MRQFHCVTIIERLHKPRWYSPLHTEAIWYSLSLLGYKPVPHATVQNHMRLNPHKRTDAINRPGKHEMVNTAASVTLYAVL